MILIVIPELTSFGSFLPLLKRTVILPFLVWTTYLNDFGYPDPELQRLTLTQENFLLKDYFIRMAKQKIIRRRKKKRMLAKKIINKKF